MSREINPAESFETIFNAFSHINFANFDFSSVKESLIEYIKLYHKEAFNDYIESSEFIAILEMFAYISELYSYRLDINAHENFITVAQRKQSILRLAKMLSYPSSRNIPARGLVKINSVKTTENVLDSNGVNLANRVIRWNDPNNSSWKEQFLLVMNQVLRQEFGTVAPGERVQIDDVLFELYELENNTIQNGVFPYSAIVSGESVGMELVPVELNEFGPLESRPDKLAPFSILFGSDGLGDGSDTTGFFLYTKQGTITTQQSFFDGITPNQTLDINVDNINNTDVWLNNIDPQTNAILNDGSVIGSRSGEWDEVDLAHAQNIIFNTNPRRNKYEIETLEDDEIRFIFGDGEFSNIPNGTFDIWYRTSLNRDIVIPKNSIINQTSLFTYTGNDTNTQTFTFEFSLINSIQNAAPSEELEHIRNTAPAVFYTQNRMVNAQDYNSFPLQDTTILKLRAVNRTYAGDSKYITWHEPRETYEDVKLFGDDLALYFKQGNTAVDVTNNSDASNVFDTYIAPLLTSSDYFTIVTSRGINPSDIRTAFTADERQFIINEMVAASLAPPQIIDLYYTVSSDHWNIGSGLIIYFATSNTRIGSGVNDQLFKFDILSQAWINAPQYFFQSNPSVNPVTAPLVNDLLLTNTANTLSEFDAERLYRWTGAQWIEVPYTFNAATDAPNSLGAIPLVDPAGILMITITTSAGFNWNISHLTERLIAHSDNIRFWNVNNSNGIISFDTLQSNADNITILQANPDDTKVSLLTQNWHFNVLGQELLEPNIAATGLPDIHLLSILPIDVNGDNIPDNMDLSQIINPVYTSTTAGEVIDLVLPVWNTDIERSPLSPDGTVEYSFEGGPTFSTIVGSTASRTDKIDKIHVVTLPIPGSITFNVTDYVYFQREDIDLDTGEFTWNPVPTTSTSLEEWNLSAIAVDGLWKREKGRFPFNFLWMHRTPRFNLIDPSPTNIIDMYIISRGYYTSIQRWLEGQTTIQPDAPSSLTLRNDYNHLIDNKMISDTIILHSGKFKILFGSLASPELQAKFKVIRNNSGILTNNQIKVRIVGLIQEFFDIDSFEFGETFYFTELAAKIHTALTSEINSIVLVPLNSANAFGDLFQIRAKEDEIFQPHVSVNDIELVESYNPTVIRQR